MALKKKPAGGTRAAATISPKAAPVSYCTAADSGRDSVATTAA